METKEKLGLIMRNKTISTVKVKDQIYDIKDKTARIYFIIVQLEILAILLDKIL